jgi:hypothetical protein
MNDKSRVREALLDELATLSPAQRAEVMDFVEFLTSRSVRFPLEQYLCETGNGDIDLEEVRKQLSTIEGSMSDTVRILREERG